MWIKIKQVHVMSINIYKFITNNHYYCFSPPFEVNRFISLCPQLAQIEEVQSHCDCHFSGPHIVQDAVSSRFVGFSSRTVRAKICREKMPQCTKSLVHGGVLWPCWILATLRSRTAQSKRGQHFKLLWLHRPAAVWYASRFACLPLLDVPKHLLVTNY